ncbi:MAG: glycerol dehydrogenase [Firmicutes bacterium]|nr:glycerol dehydrogenase [Bacillota bacterium]
MDRIMVAPGKYIQGPGVLENLGEHVVKLGDQPLVIVDKGIIGFLGDQIKRSLTKHLEPLIDLFGGECSRPEITRLQKKAGENANIVVGIGGGKVIDTAKAVAYYLKVPVVIVPTTAATDAPTSALSVIYSETGVFAEYLFLPHNPDLVLLDTAVIAAAPPRFLASGMGDALATRFEAEACAKSSAQTMAGGRTTLAALTLARLCYDTLLAYGEQAIWAVENKAVTPALEYIVEANTLLSGLGFESSGLAAAHAIHNGLTALEGTDEAYHGEKVAFSTLVQLVLEGRSMEEIEEVIGFCLSVGLPITLAQLGVQKVDVGDIMRVAEAATQEGETIHNMPFEVTAPMVRDAILATDAMGQAYLGD